MARLRKINGNYYAYFYDKNRRPNAKSYPLGVQMKSAATKMLRRLEDEYADGSFDPWNPGGRSSILSVTEAKQRFLKSREHLRPKTQEAYREILENWPLPPDLTLRNLSADHIRPYVTSRTNAVRKDARTFKGRRKDTVSVATLRKRYRHLRTLFNWLLKNDLIDESPLAGIQPPPAEESVPDFLTPKQLKRLLRCIDADHVLKQDEPGITPEVGWLKDMIHMAVCTGMRRGELANLKWTHVDLETGFITARNEGNFRTKSGKERRIPLKGEAREVVHRRAGSGSKYVLTKNDGSPVNAGYASTRFKHYLRMAKLPDYIKFHSLRDTCASWLVQDGVPLAFIQQILGHSDSSVTEKYAHLAPDLLAKAMEGTFGK